MKVHKTKPQNDNKQLKPFEYYKPDLISNLKITIWFPCWRYKQIKPTNLNDKQKCIKDFNQLKITIWKLWKYKQIKPKNVNNESKMFQILSLNFG